MSIDTRERLVAALSELVDGELDDEGEYETLDALSGAQLRRLVDAVVSGVLRIEREAGRSVDELLEDEAELSEVLDALEGIPDFEGLSEEDGDGAGYESTPGLDEGYEVGGGPWDEEGT
jgi:hypothetical protein